MKTYEGKTLEIALDKAKEDLGLTDDNISYEVLKEEKKLFSKKVTIGVYETPDIIDYLVNYLETVINLFDIEVEVKPSLKDGIIRLELNTSHNSILIGKNGRTLSALNDLVRLAANVKFKKHIRVLLDINKYKDEKYQKITSQAKQLAKKVLRTKQDIELDPMPSDERRAIHNALSSFKNIKTESIGSGHNRKIVISYAKPEQKEE